MIYYYLLWRWWALIPDLSFQILFHTCLQISVLINHGNSLVTPIYKEIVNMV